MFLGEKSGNATLHLEVARLRDTLEAERTRNANLSISLDRERGEKDETLFRNAQVNQQVELARQELREQEQESVELHNRIATMEKELSEKDRVQFLRNYFFLLFILHYVQGADKILVNQKNFTVILHHILCYPASRCVMRLSFH